MKNTVKIALLCIVVIASLIVPTISNAAEGDYKITANYPLKSVLINTEQKVSATLSATDTATPLTNVRVKVDVTGPATPKIMAEDTNGTLIDVVKEGYWGPEAGFPVLAGYNVTTDFTATFPVAGVYTATLSLVDVSGAEEKTVTSTTISMTAGTEVTLMMSGVQIGKYTTVGAQSLKDLGLENGPSDIEEGYKFAGWYTSEDFSEEVDVNAPLTTATTVYAKVVPVSEEETEEPTTPTDSEEETTENTEEVSSEEKDNTPKTGVANYAGIAIFAIVASAGVIYAIRKNRI